MHGLLSFGTYQVLEQISAQQFRDEDVDVHHSEDEKAAPNPDLSQKPQPQHRGSCTCEWATHQIHFLWYLHVGYNNKHSNFIFIVSSFAYFFQFNAAEYFN